MRSALALLLLGLVLPACSGDHDALAARPANPRDAGDSGSEGVPDAFEEAGGDEDAKGPSADDDGGAPPSKPFALAIVNGIPDAPAIRLCFVPRGEGGEEWERAISFPDDPAGLAYGRSQRASGPLAVEAADEDLALFVFAGALGEASSKSCAELLATTEETIVKRALPILPKGSFGGKRSALLVTRGCIGGEAHVAEGDEVVCGKGYSPAAPTAGLVMVAMSRATSASSIGLQAVNALSSGPPVFVEMQPDSNLVPFAVAPYLPQGAIAPLPAPTFKAESSFGVKVEAASVVLKDPNSSATRLSFSMGDALERGGLEAAEVEPGRNFTLVAVGPEPQIGSGPWWKAAAVVAVESDP